MVPPPHPRQVRAGDRGERRRRKDEKEPAAERKPERAITLTASPPSVSALERIDLSGSYRGGDGATLQVQRREGDWVDFPVTATVRGTTFATYILTSRTGASQFRVVDEATGEASNTVTVRVG